MLFAQDFELCFPFLLYALDATLDERWRRSDLSNIKYLPYEKNLRSLHA